MEADFVLDEDPNDGELLLEELEQDDILAELLHNACMYPLHHIRGRDISIG